MFVKFLILPVGTVKVFRVNWTSKTKDSHWRVFQRICCMSALLLGWTSWLPYPIYGVLSDCCSLWCLLSQTSCVVHLLIFQIRRGVSGRLNGFSKIVQPKRGMNISVPGSLLLQAQITHGVNTYSWALRCVCTMSHTLHMSKGLLIARKIQQWTEHAFGKYMKTFAILEQQIPNILLCALDREV